MRTHARFMSAFAVDEQGKRGGRFASLLAWTIMLVYVGAIVLGAVKLEH